MGWSRNLFVLSCVRPDFAYVDDFADTRMISRTVKTSPAVECRYSGHLSVIHAFVPFVLSNLPLYHLVTNNTHALQHKVFVRSHLCCILVANTNIHEP